MRKILGLYVRLANRKGASAVEYALIIAVIALVMVAGAVVLGTSLEQLFTNIGATLQSYTT